MGKPLYKFQVKKGVTNKAEDSIQAEKLQREELENTLGLKDCESVWFVNNDSRHIDNDYYWLEPNIEVGELHPKKDPWERPAHINKITRYVSFDSVKNTIEELQRKIKEFEEAEGARNTQRLEGRR